MRPVANPYFLLAGAAAATLVCAIEPHQIQGSTPRSPYVGQSLVGIHGIVTAKGPSGLWIQGAPDNNSAKSDSVYVYTTSAAIRNQTDVGDEILLNGKVAEYRASDGDLYLTEITNPSNITKLSTGNIVTPIVLGIDRLPPTTLYSEIDEQNGGVFGYPNNVTTVSTANKTAQPEKYGLDFWASLDGALVTVPSPVALGFDSQYSEFWAYGAWPVTGKNARGGLTITSDANGVVDANPEAIMIGTPLDGTKNPGIVTMGSKITDVTGIVTFQYNFFRILPLTAPKVIEYPSAIASPTRYTSTPYNNTSKCQQITFGSYNVENLAPTSKHLKNVSEHLVNWMKSPDLLILQEVQDDSGPTDDGTVSANKTLAALRDGIIAAGGANYSWAVVDPVNNMDGGEPGGNIRVAFMYRPDVLQLVNPNIGSSNDSTAVRVLDGKWDLTFNPGRIEPTNSVFTSSRKPLAALFEAVATKERILAIDVHQSSKGGSSPIHGDPRPPVNGVIDARIGQAKVTANFISSVLAATNSTARVIVGGDFNEFTQTKVAFTSYFSNGMLEDADEVVNIEPVERYTYQYDMNAQQLDHILVSKEVAKTLEYEHIHVNTWAESYEARVSDHDPSVGRIKVCSAPPTNQCSFRVATWCAPPLPTFNSFATCLESAGVCYKQNLDCYKTLKFPTNLECSKHSAKCVEYTASCTKCLIGGSCSSFPN